MLTTLENQTEIPSDGIPLALLADPVAAAAILDGVALFELLGAKWMLAIVFDKWNADIHSHAADELRHTKLVQDAAKKLRWDMSPEELCRENTLNKICYQATEEYLSRLSKKIFRLTIPHGQASDAFAISAYALLSFLIERRIMKIYPHFAKHGPTQEVRDLAKTLIHDERKHITMVASKLPSSLDCALATQEEIVRAEEELAAEWLAKISHAAKLH